MVGWHHRPNGHEFEQAPGDSEGQGSVVCCNSWGHKESDMTEELNWTEENKSCFIHVNQIQLLALFFLVPQRISHTKAIMLILWIHK